MKFGTLLQILNPMTVPWQKIEIFKLQDGGGRHLENRFFVNNLSTDFLISAKFCVRKQNSMPTKATWQKLQIFKIQDGGRPLFFKSLNRHISVKNRLILMKFGTYSRYWTRWQSCDQKLKFSKFKIAAATILKNRFFGHNSSNDCPISAKFCVRKQNGIPTKTTRQKLHIFKIQDGRRPPFWKLLNHHYLSEKLSDFDDIWCTTADIEPDNSHLTKH